jgi:hypothetical protein
MFRIIRDQTMYHGKKRHLETVQISYGGQNVQTNFPNFLSGRTKKQFFRISKPMVELFWYLCVA